MNKQTQSQQLLSASGKIPPSDKSIEADVLGVILIEKNAINTAAGLLKPDTFYLPEHVAIYSVIDEMYRKGIPIDLLTVSTALKKAGKIEDIGGAYYLTQLTGSVVSGENIQQWCFRLVELKIQRDIIRLGNDLIANGFESDAFDLIKMAQEGINSITNQISIGNVKSLKSIGETFTEKSKNLMQRSDELTGITTGYKDLDILTCGWQRTDLIILAARPAVGKSAFALNLALNAAKAGIRVGFFSLEMGEEQLYSRIAANNSSIRMDYIKKGRFNDFSEVYEITVGLDNIPIYMDDNANHSIVTLRAALANMVNKLGVELVFIDYLQLLSGLRDKNTNREQEISQMSRELKKIAKTFKVPIIALSQLSRDIEKRGNKEPMLSDLRESGAIEQDADVVMFLYSIEIEKTPTTVLKIAKHRNGSLDSISFDANLSLQRFTEAGSLGKWKPVE